MFETIIITDAYFIYNLKCMTFDVILCDIKDFFGISRK